MLSFCMRPSRGKAESVQVGEDAVARREALGRDMGAESSIDQGTGAQRPREGCSGRGPGWENVRGRELGGFKVRQGGHVVGTQEGR